MSGRTGLKVVVLVSSELSEDSVVDSLLKTNLVLEDSGGSVGTLSRILNLRLVASMDSGDSVVSLFRMLNLDLIDSVD